MYKKMCKSILEDVKIRPSFLTSFRGSSVSPEGWRCRRLRLNKTGGVDVFESVNITSLFTVHWSLFVQGLVLARPGGIVPVLKAKNNILTSRRTDQRSSQGNSYWRIFAKRKSKKKKNFETEFLKKKTKCRKNT